MPIIYSNGTEWMGTSPMPRGAGWPGRPQGGPPKGKVAAAAHVPATARVVAPPPSPSPDILAVLH